MAGGGGVEKELWNIFTFYTLRGNPLELTRISVTQFLRLARDCQIIKGVPVESNGVTTRKGRGQRDAKSKPPPVLEKRRLGPATVNLAFASVLQRRYRAPPSSTASRPSCRDRLSAAPARGGQAESAVVVVSRANHLLNYPEFLDTLVILGERMYRPRPRGRSHFGEGDHSSRMMMNARGNTRAEATFQQLLMENILPLASRRSSVAVAAELRDPLVRDILRHYGPALREIFRFYAASPSDGDAEREKPRARERSETLDPDSAAATPASVPSTPSMAASETVSRSLEPALVTPAEGVHSCMTAVVANVDADAAAEMSAGLTQGPTPLAATTSTDCGHGYHDASAAVSNDATADAAAVVPESDYGRRKGCNKGGRGRNDSGGGGACSGQGARRRRRRRQKNMPSAVINSMANALSHRSLLCFVADFGISGALVSGLDVGEVFLSCGGGGGLSENIDDYGDDEARSSSQEFTRASWRTSLAREGRGDVRPLVFTEFLEALVRIALACFRPRCTAAAGTTDAGHCLRALLTYVWRRLHASAELALNGVRAGESRYRSSIQKGALLRGVQLFNDRMLSRWRAEGFIDFAADSASGAVNGATRRSTGWVAAVPASEILRKLLVLKREENTPVLRA